MQHATPERIVELMVQELGIEEVSPTTSIFSSGILDSIDVVNLVMILEAEFAVRVDPAFVDVAHFDNAVAIAEVIRRLRD